MKDDLEERYEKYDNKIEDGKRLRKEDYEGMEKLKGDTGIED